MGLFRKRETYNEQMLREAGLGRVRFRDPTPAPSDPPPVGPGAKFPLSVWNVMPAVETGPMPWDAVATARVPALAGETARFTALPNGDLIVADEEGDADMSPLADAIEEHLQPPYKAAASRQEGDLWGVGAKRIEVAQFAFPDADTLELAQSDGSAELRADGEPSDATAPVELQRLGEREDGDFCVVAERIDGDYWEVKVSPL